MILYRAGNALNGSRIAAMPIFARWSALVASISMHPLTLPYILIHTMTMKRVLLLVAFVLPCTITGNEVRLHEVNDHNRKDPVSILEHPEVNIGSTTKETTRDLQDDPTFIELIQSTCDMVGDLLLLDGVATCDCEFSFTVEFACVADTTICGSDLRLCSVPTVTGSFDVLQKEVTFGFCSDEATFDDIPLPDFCVEVSGTLVPPNSTSSTSSKSGSVPPAQKQYLTEISMSVGGKQCRSVSLCNSGQGYKFDCTNIDKRLKQSACTPLQTLMNLQQSPGSVKFLPDLDDPAVPIAAPVKVPVSSPVAAPVPLSFLTLMKLATATKAPTKAPTNAPKGMMKRLVV